MKIYLLLAFLILTTTFCKEVNEDETEITFNEEEVRISQETVILQGTEVVIENPGVFTVKGKTDQGNIVITSSSVTLNIDSLNLSSKNKAPIIILDDLKDIHINFMNKNVIKDL